MTHTLKEQSEQLLKVIGVAEHYIEEIREETTNAMVRTITEQIDDYLLDIDEYATSIDFLLEDMEQTHEQWLDEQIKKMFLQVDNDQKAIAEVLKDDKKVVNIADLIINELNETKYKDTKYKANENDIRVWLMSMITLHHYMFERGNLRYSESFNPYVILDLDK